MQPQGVSGIVEELGLRMTKIRSLSGELSPTACGVSNYVSGQQRFTIEVQLSDAEAVPGSSTPSTRLRALHRPAALVGARRPAAARLRIVAGVLPSMAWLIEEHLVERAKEPRRARTPRSSPLVYKVDQANLRRIRELLPKRSRRTCPQRRRSSRGL